jgi:Cu/Ag efflux pump CusA
MVENIYRELSERHGQQYSLTEVLLHAAKDVDRPIFYSVAVIIAGYLPIYALSGPAGKLFHPMADTMAFARALVACLGLLPAAVSTGVGSDTQKPLAIVVVAGLVSRLVLGFFVNPVLYEVVAHDADRLQV